MSARRLASVKFCTMLPENLGRDICDILWPAPRGDALHRGGLAAHPAAAKVISVSATTPDANEKLQEALISSAAGRYGATGCRRVEADRRTVARRRQRHGARRRSRRGRLDPRLYGQQGAGEGLLVTIRRCVPDRLRGAQHQGRRHQVEGAPTASSITAARRMDRRPQRKPTALMASTRSRAATC